MMHSPGLEDVIELFALFKQEERDADGHHEVWHNATTA